MNKENLKITSYKSSISELPDYPSDKGYSARQLKELFDARSDGEIKEKHNALVDAFAEAEDKSSKHIENRDNPHSITKAQIGLSNVDNTSDMDKPISNSAKALFDELSERIEGVDEFRKHCGKNDNPHGVTKEQLGLSNVDNTSDADKPMSEKTRRYIDELNWKNAPKNKLDYAEEHNIRDCTDGVFAEISLVGKSVQNALPGVSNNVEFESVENPTITLRSTPSAVEKKEVTFQGITLHGIMNFGDVWICRDEINMSDGRVKLIRRCGIIEDASTLGWVAGDKTGVYYAELDVFYMGDGVGSFGYCTSYRYGFADTQNTFNAGSNQISAGGKSYIVFNTDVETLDQFKRSMENQKILYALENPTETDLTETEAGRALCALRTKYPEIYIASNTDLSITYACDIRTFLEDMKKTTSDLGACTNMLSGDMEFLRERIDIIESRIFM